MAENKKIEFDCGIPLPDFSKPVTHEDWVLAVFPEWKTYLNQQINSYKVPKGQVSMWWCGCCSWVIKTDEDSIFCIDMYAGPSGHTHYGQCGVCRQTGAESIHWMRLQPHYIDPWAFDHIDGYFMSHIHGDHTDPWFVSAAVNTSDTKFYGPKLVTDLLPNYKVPDNRIVTCQVGDVIELPGAKVHMLINYDQTAIQTLGGKIMDYEDCCLSYLFETSGGNLLFLGDTWFHDGYVAFPQKYKIDVTTTNMGFNAPGGTDKLTPYEVARLAKMLKTNVIIPDHYDFWANIAGEPNLIIDQFERLTHEIAPEVKTVVMRGGGRFDYPKDQDIGRYWYPDESDGYRYEYSATAIEEKERMERRKQKNAE